MAKRQRCEGRPWWQLLRDDVVSNAGFVHSALEFSESERLLTVKEKVSNDEIVLRIPAKNFMTRHRAISMCQPWLDKILVQQPNENSTWNNSSTDLAIAIAMASCQSPDEYLYLYSLPDSSSFDALPRRWSDKEMQDLLAGTSLLRHVLSAKRGVIEDYDLLFARYQKWSTEETNSGVSGSRRPFPSFEKFSDMLAAVTSRAFQIGNSPEDVAIVPLLDLGNHTRGKSTTKLEKKNVSYNYNAAESAIVVRATMDIEVGESIRLTYGAKANAQLLLNYGFCIPRNLEPDGSSNDILEFRVDQTDDNENRTTRKTIALRAGPKSYSYGGFVATLEEYFNDEQGEETGAPRPDDLEDFLNECDNENDDEDEGGFMDLYGGQNVGSEVEEENQEASDSEEIEALGRFKSELIELSKGYNSYKDEDIPAMLSGQSRLTLSQVYSAILSLSELRTIYFFRRAIDKAQHLLRSSTSKDDSIKSSAMHGLSDPEDLAVIERQTDDLAKAYMAIRHGGL